MTSYTSARIRRSYLKTTALVLALVPLGLSCVWVGIRWLPPVLGTTVAVVGMLGTLCAATLAAAGVVVLARHERGKRGQPDLFLELNKSRTPTAIRSVGPVRVTWARRWLARRLLGHDLVVGDVVEVKAWPEIRATLDDKGCLEALPFMPEMLSLCGQRAYVFRCMHRMFDYRKTRRMRHMNDAVLLVGAVCDGTHHGGCEAGCHTIWKSAWLRRIETAEGPAIAPVSRDRGAFATDTDVPRFGTQGSRYACQLTQLNAASHPISEWSAANFLRPLVAGNVTPAAFIVGWLTNLFNGVQQLRQGVGFPAFEQTAQDDGSGGETRFAAGDQVIVRSSGEIRATLNDRLEHRGLGFEADMLKYCGRRCRVQREIRFLIDIVTGEIRAMKTPAYILRDVHFSGERQLFNAQYEPLFWRSQWLRRVDERTLLG